MHIWAGCAVAVSQPNGAAVLAVPDDGGTLVSVRAPGHGWGALTRFPGGGYFSGGRAAVAGAHAGGGPGVWLQGCAARQVRRVG